MPGPITGNALHGLCERACIEVKKVFDAGLLQQEFTNVPVALTNPVPPNPTEPLTFVSAVSSTSKGIVTNLRIDRLDNPQHPRQSRVRCNVGIPMTVVFVDANGAEGVADAVFPISLDIILCAPEASVIPFEVAAVVSAIASDGFITLTTATLSCCVTVILKFIIEAELLVPSYGYCRIPPMEGFSSDACAGFFELPLYP